VHCRKPRKKNKSEQERERERITKEKIIT
jgi:hypothetical protein